MITVLGGSGFVGKNIVKHLKKEGKDFWVPERDEVLKGKDLGDLIYCIGLTADFRTKPFDTVEAHVCKLSNILSACDFRSLTYLSSTRVYIRCDLEEVNENTSIYIDIFDPEELYTLTKLTGERICLSSGRNVKIARLSNVLGDDTQSENFISSIVRTIKSEKSIQFQTTLDSSKDYISVSSVAKLLVQIAEKGKEAMYNVASGINITNGSIVNLLQGDTMFEYSVVPAAKKIAFSRINNDKIKQEFGFNTDAEFLKIKSIIKNYTHDTN